MNKRMRQYAGLACAILAYYCIHEGAHLVYALMTDTFKAINFMGLGIQIDIFRERMTDTQLGIFCLLGSVATTVTAYVLVLLTDRIVKMPSPVMRAILYYVTLAMLLLDPAYLSVLCSFFGGGDMNGIMLLIPETIARILYGAVMIVNGLVFWKIVLPKYTESFAT